MTSGNLKLGSAVFAIGAAMMIASGPAQAQTKVLSGERFVQIHADQCISYWGASEGTQCFNADGTTNYDDTTYGTDTGVWRVDGNDVCVTWSQEAVESCGPVMKAGEGVYRDNDGYTWSMN